MAHIYIIKFQKRGLLHALILTVLWTGYKFSAVERIDSLISAEIPDLVLKPSLYEIITRCMIHGPRGSNNPQAPCMEAQSVQKVF